MSEQRPDDNKNPSEKKGDLENFSDLNLSSSEEYQDDLEDFHSPHLNLSGDPESFLDPVHLGTELSKVVYNSEYNGEYYQITDNPIKDEVDDADKLSVQSTSSNTSPISNTSVKSHVKTVIEKFSSLENLSEAKSVEGRNLKSSTRFGSVGNLSETKNTKGRSLRSNTQAKPITGSNIGHIDPTTASRYRQNKNVKMGSKLEFQKDQIQTMTDRFNAYKITINTLLEKQDKSAEDKISLEENYNKLKSHKDLIAQKSRKLQSAIEEAYNDKEAYTALAALEVKYTDLEGPLFSLMDKVKAILDRWKKDDDILDTTRMSIPDFWGTFGEWNNFSSTFGTLTEHSGKKNKRIRLLEAVKGEARVQIEDLIDEGADFQAMWDELESVYGDPRNQTDSLITRLFSIEQPKDDNNELKSHFNTFKNRSSNIVSLKLSTENLLAAYYMLQIPTKLRSNIEAEFEADHTKFTFKEIAPIIKRLCRTGIEPVGKKSKETSCSVGQVEEVSAAVGHAQPKSKNNGGNDKVASDSRNSNHHRQPGGGRGGGRRNYGNYLYCNHCKKEGHTETHCHHLKCILCDEKHHHNNCGKYKPGPEVKKRLGERGYCSDCCSFMKRGFQHRCRLITCTKCSGNHCDITCAGTNDKSQDNKNQKDPDSGK